MVFKCIPTCSAYFGLMEKLNAGRTGELHTERPTVSQTVVFTQLECLFFFFFVSFIRHNSLTDLSLVLAILAKIIISRGGTWVGKVREGLTYGSPKSET